MKTGIELIAAERLEQITKHNRQIKDDVLWNTDYQLRVAAMRLIGDRNDHDAPSGWDKKAWSKMLRKPMKDRLVIAGALLAAEIDRQEEINAVVESIKNK